MNKKRGLFILFEGLDRSGKSTQCDLAAQHLSGNVVKFQFPTRTTSIGQCINEYLSNKKEFSDQSIHLLFTADRWQLREKMVNYLQTGQHLIVDRYCYSGMAYSMAKGFNMKWCLSPEIGLPEPDIIFYLEIDPNKQKNRENWGEERYENTSFQFKVLSAFKELQDKICPDKWHILDATKDKKTLASEISIIIDNTIISRENIPIDTVSSLVASRCNFPIEELDNRREV